MTTGKWLALPLGYVSKEAVLRGLVKVHCTPALSQHCLSVKLGGNKKGANFKTDEMLISKRPPGNGFGQDISQCGEEMAVFVLEHLTDSGDVSTDDHIQTVASAVKFVSGAVSSVHHFKTFRPSKALLELKPKFPDNGRTAPIRAELTPLC